MLVAPVSLLTKGGGGGIQLTARQVGPGEVAALVVVVLDVERAQFGEVDPERAAAVIDVLTVQTLKEKRPQITTT